MNYPRYFIDDDPTYDSCYFSEVKEPGGNIVEYWKDGRVITSNVSEEVLDGWIGNNQWGYREFTGAELALILGIFLYELPTLFYHVRAR